MTPKNLSKSKYLAGQQCLKRVWLACHHRELAAAPDRSLQAIFDMGHEIGRHATMLFPGGVLVEEKAWEHEKAVARTAELVADERIPAIFEAAFEYRNVRIRVDVLERLPGGQWGLREVKAAASLKDVHIDDLAIQQFVLAGCGISVASAQLIHVNRDYVRGEGEIDWGAFFVRQEPETRVAEAASAVPARVDEMHRVLAQSAAPAIEPSRHCFKPYSCDFWQHCTQGKPADWVFLLPGLQATQFDQMRQEGIERIPEIPAGFALSPRQRRAWRSYRRGHTHVSERLSNVLGGSGPPAFYFDVETVNPGVPLWPGTRPFQAIPFQWSLHHVDTEGHVTHREYLADGSEDPRPGFANSLLAALSGSSDPILVYSPYESRILGEASRQLPDLAAGLHKLQDRLVDLYPIVREHVYDPAFRGSFSIKTVAPALADGFGYGDLEEIAEGGAASAAFLQIASASVDGEAEQRTRENLLAYCARDTEALVELHRSLLGLAGSSQGADDTATGGLT